MIWHLSFSDFLSTSPMRHYAYLFHAADLGVAQHKVESFCNAHFEDGINPNAELTGEWVCDNLFFLNATVNGKEGTIARAYITTVEQRQENKEQSRHSNTSEGTFLFLDIERDLKQGLPVEQIRERVYREYEHWVIKEVIRDGGLGWLISPLADANIPPV